MYKLVVVILIMDLKYVGREHFIYRVVISLVEGIGSCHRIFWLLICTKAEFAYFFKVNTLASLLVGLNWVLQLTF